MAALLRPGTATPVVSPFDSGGGGSDPAGFFAHHGVWAPGVKLFRQLGFRAKALIVSAVLVLPMLLVLGLQMRASYHADFQAHADAVREHVQIAHGVLVWAHGQEQAGRMSREQAQALAREAIAQLRYADGDYFWINDMTPRMVMHPVKPELDGRDLADFKDPNGVPLFKRFVETVQRDRAGFVAYQWPKPGSQQPVDKVSYVMGFEPWGWIVGSGVYVDHVASDFAGRAWTIGTVIVLALLLGGYLFYSFYLVMEGGLKETRRHLRAMTDGDLTTRPEPWGRDEAAQLMIALREMQDALRTIVTEVRTGSDEILHSSSEIASGAMDLSARTEKTAANLEETVASMEEISGAVKSTADNANAAVAIARANATAAAEGGRTIAQVVQTMDGIGESSKRIGEIIGVIDGIAFQTNILALNAAVEAARAGDAGRGFAVVASEVRALAQRSAAAAREIKALITTSVEQAQAGNAVVGQAREQLERAALHDALTGVANRKGFEAAMARVFAAPATQRPASIVMIDLDHFKPINDTAGHAAGDAVLVAVAQAIGGAVRTSDVVARLGGDEFAVLLPRCTQAQAVVVAEKVRRAILDIALPWQGRTLRVGASLGVAELGDGHADAAQWLADADDACYAAKRSGRGAVRERSAALRLVYNEG
ncbi:MAG: methyl-accepting chemotaxis protein [Rubrivivax sp.]